MSPQQHEAVMQAEDLSEPSGNGGNTKQTVRSAPRAGVAGITRTDHFESRVFQTPGTSNLRRCEPDS